jgi:GNAT superfamily N-acetyltransferase
MRVRPATPDDAWAVAVVHVRSWQVAYRGLMPEELLDAQRPEDRAARYDFAPTDPDAPRTLVAEEDGSLGGFVTIAASADPAVGGEVYALYVDPDRWGTGMGLALMTAGRAALVEQGFTTAGLWVLVGNERARHFYTVDGWRPDGVRRQDQVWGVEVDEERWRTRLA